VKRLDTAVDSEQNDTWCIPHTATRAADDRQKIVQKFSTHGYCFLPTTTDQNSTNDRQDEPAHASVYCARREAFRNK